MRSSKVIVITAFIICIPLAVRAQEETIGAERVLQLMKARTPATLIDVRPPAEYRDGHVPGAINIPVDRLFAEGSKLPADKGAPVIFYCRGAG